jgi:hypothetical protein
MQPLPLARLLIVLVLLVASMVPFGTRARQLTAAGVAPTELRVSAGSYDRRQTVVTVSLPAPQSNQDYELHDGTGGSLPVQVDREGRGWFVLPALDAGAERVYVIAVRDRHQARSVATATPAGSDVSVAIGGTPVLTYVGGAGRLPSGDIKPAFQRGGYIHPIRTPSGRIVTDDYPADHRHQHGVMFAWTSAEFEGRKTDFWNMGNVLGRVEAAGMDVTWSGPVHAGWTARHRYVDLTSGAPKPVVDEQWTTRVYALAGAAKPLNVFDVDVRQVPATSVPLLLPEYHYGGMAVRGAASFIGAPANEIVLTSEGKDRASADNTRARWAHISGSIDGARAGIAMLGHPDNFRAPEPLRVHPTDPYICFAPSRLGAWSITAERPFIAKYRFVVTDGGADAALVDRLWRDYADPPRVTVR